MSIYQVELWFDLPYHLWFMQTRLAELTMTVELRKLVATINVLVIATVSMTNPFAITIRAIRHDVRNKPSGRK